MPNVRKKAVECLIRCERGGYSNLVLMQELASGRFDARDRAFCTALVYGTLSRRLTIDRFLENRVNTPLSRLDEEMLEILRTGVYQLFWMDSVPARATVNESVSLCREFRKTSASGLVNAVLRRCSDADISEAWSGIEDWTEYLAVRYSISPKLVQILSEQYGEQTEQVLESMSVRSSLYLRVNSLVTDERSAAEALREEGIETEPTGLSNCLRVVSGFSGHSELMDRGEIRIQGFPEQFAASCLEAEAGSKVLDMCSAPGGKTMCIAQDMKNEGSVTALDSSESRLELVRKLAAKEKINIVETLCGDASVYDSSAVYDRILCDVPCSGYGEIPSKPELRYKDPQISEDLPELQYRILCNAARMLAPSGRIVYSTCTILDRENRSVVNRFLRDNPGFRLAVPGQLPDCAEAVDGTISFTPGRGGSEGFFIAVLRQM